MKHAIDLKAIEARAQAATPGPWTDWIGAYWDTKGRRLYLLPVPCLGVVLHFPKPESEAK